jgi:hypothetical protein
MGTTALAHGSSRRPFNLVHREAKPIAKLSRRSETAKAIDYSLRRVLAEALACVASC